MRAPSNRSRELKDAIVRVRQLSTSLRYRYIDGVWKVRVYKDGCRPFWMKAFYRKRS